MPGFGLRTLCEMNFKTYLFYKISSRDNYCTKLSPRVQFSLVLWVDSDHGGLHYLHSVRTVLSFCHNSKDCKNRNSKQMTRSVITICTWCESQFLIAVILSYLSLRSWLNNVSRHFKLRWYLRMAMCQNNSYETKFIRDLYLPASSMSMNSNIWHTLWT